MEDIKGIGVGGGLGTVPYASLAFSRRVYDTMMAFFPLIFFFLLFFCFKSPLGNGF